MKTSRIHQRPAISTLFIPGPRFRRVTKDKISSPVSPSFPGLPDVTPLWHEAALEFLSRKLQAKHLHLTLIISRATTSIELIPACDLDDRTRSVLRKALVKVTQQFDIGKQWLDALERKPFLASSHTSDLRRRSILQNEVLFSSEGLTLLNIDHVYSFKQRLATLSSSTSQQPFDSDFRSCVHQLRRVCRRYGGRPLTKAYIARAYDHLQYNEEDLRQICAAYESKYGCPGIVLSGRDSASPMPNEPAKTFPRHSCAQEGPKTPNSPTDITPTTKVEWELLIMLQC